MGFKKATCSDAWVLAKAGKVPLKVTLLDDLNTKMGEVIINGSSVAQRVRVPSFAIQASDFPSVITVKIDGVDDTSIIEGVLLCWD